MRGDLDFNSLEQLDIPSKKLQQFNKKKIETMTDLLFFFPRKYNDYTRLSTRVVYGEPCCLILTLKEVKNSRSSKGISALNAYLYDKNERKYQVTWYNSDFLEMKIKKMIGKQVLVAGKIDYNNFNECPSFTTPDVFDPDIKNALKIYPVYSKISGMSDEYLDSCIDVALDEYVGIIPSILPIRFEKQWNLISRREAITLMHRPSSSDDIEKAQRRLRYDDIYYFCKLADSNSKKMSEKTSVTIKSTRLMDTIVERLPYSLTEDQIITVFSMRNQMLMGKRLHALVQGDVGCGKTIVALLMMAILAENGYQAVLMAPTSVLAEQHYKDLVEMFEPYGYSVELIKPLNQLKKKDKEDMLERIASGSSKLLVGTHSLLNDGIEFNKLGLIITDEEHKFGVEQREKLMDKAADGVHYLTMSATPIPRSLASILYGSEMQLHIIKSMPKGRVPVQTAINNSWTKCMEFVRTQITPTEENPNGRQVYVVCPQVDDGDGSSEIASVKFLEQEYAKYFPAECIVTLSGKNTKKETEEILRSFKANEKKILIATTVVEVGVNVPNANTIIIHNAERFGLASLHQLRGRVGRGGGKAYCILFSNDKTNPRLQVMVKTTNGFEISAADLEQRGAGDIITGSNNMIGLSGHADKNGIKQSGVNYYVDLLMEYPEDYQVVRSVFSNNN